MAFQSDRLFRQPGSGVTVGVDCLCCVAGGRVVIYRAFKLMAVFMLYLLLVSILGLYLLILSKAIFLELIVGSVEHILVQGVQQKLS